MKLSEEIEAGKEEEFGSCRVTEGLHLIISLDAVAGTLWPSY